MKFDDLLKGRPVAINIGVEDFAAALQMQGAEVVDVNWTPPAGGDTELADLLDQIL